VAVKSDINWNEIAKVEMRPGAPSCPELAVKTIAKHSPSLKSSGPRARGAFIRGDRADRQVVRGSVTLISA